MYELAKALGVESKDIITKLEEVGEYVKSASSTVEAPVIRRLHEKFPELKEAAAKAPAPAKKAPAKKVAAAVEPAQEAQSPTTETPEVASAPASPVAPDSTPSGCLLYTSPSPRDRTRSRMPSSA